MPHSSFQARCVTSGTCGEMWVSLPAIGEPRVEEPSKHKFVFRLVRLMLLLLEHLPTSRIACNCLAARIWLVLAYTDETGCEHGFEVRLPQKYSQQRKVRIFAASRALPFGPALDSKPEACQHENLTGSCALPNAVSLSSTNNRRPMISHRPYAAIFMIQTKSPPHLSLLNIFSRQSIGGNRP